MATTPENYLADASKAALETLETATNSTLDSAEKLATLNLETARSSFDQQMEGTTALMQARNFQDFLALQNTLTKPVLQNAISYCSSAYAIANESQQELRRLAENGYAEFAKSVNSILDKAAKAAPGSSDVAVAAVKSAMNAANTAYNQMNDAAQKAKEIAEGSAQASANATSKAIGAVVTKSKKK
ncbi:MAG: phasin family protein [Proteobacteria bacterium]|nr:phasin family protein [Pseudomonadota bacterium]